MPLLFAYGTLRDPAVQQANFGRELPAREDRIIGFRLDLLDVGDPQVVAVSGQAQHPILVPTDDPTDSIAGSVLELTDDELRRADEYEIDDYKRIEASLASGDIAWVFVGAVHAAP